MTEAFETRVCGVEEDSVSFFELNKPDYDFLSTEIERVS